MRTKSCRTPRSRVVQTGEDEGICAEGAGRAVRGSNSASWASMGRARGQKRRAVSVGDTGGGPAGRRAGFTAVAAQEAGGDQPPSPSSLPIGQGERVLGDHPPPGFGIGELGAREGGPLFSFRCSPRYLTLVYMEGVWARVFHFGGEFFPRAEASFRRGGPPLP